MGHILHKFCFTLLATLVVAACNPVVVAPGTAGNTPQNTVDQ